MSSIPTWLSQALYNRWRGSYFSGDVDTEGNVVIRGSSSLWLDTNASVKLNGGSVTTLSNAELTYLDGVTSSIQTQINGKASNADVTTLQTKTQNITATSVLTTIEDNVTLSTGNLVLTNGDLTIAGTKSLFMNGEFNLGTTGRISGTGLTISNAQLAYLNGLTANIESRLASVVTKTQLLISTASLATFSNAVTLTTGNLTLTLGNLVLTNGDLSVIAGKSILNNGVLNFGTTGTIKINNVDITNAQIGYLTGLTASVETRIENNTTNIATNTSNIATNTSNIATNTTNIATNTTNIGTNTTDITTILGRITGISFNSGLNLTYINHSLFVNGGIDAEFGLICNNIMAVKSTATTSNILCRSPDTAGDTTTRQLAGDGVISTSNPMVLVCSPSDTQTNALRITSTQFQIFMDILANNQTVTPTNLGRISGLSSNCQDQLTALQTKTANMTASGAATTFTGTTNLNSTTNISNNRELRLNGTAKLVLLGTSSIELGTSLGILTTGTIYINATELSYLNNISSNIQDSITGINNNLTDLNLKTTQQSYDAPSVTTTFANVVNFTGTTKTTGTTWADGPIKLKTTFVAPVAGELGYTVTSLLNTGVISVTKNVVRSILQINLTIGVWVITYNAFVIFSATNIASIKIGLNTTSGSTQPNQAYNFEGNPAYVATKNFPMSHIVNLSSATTFYLTCYVPNWNTGSISIDGGNVDTTTLSAVRIA